MIIDTHIHLDDEVFKDDLDEVLQRAKEEKVERFIIPGTSEKNLIRAKEIALNYDSIYYGVGIHPIYASSYSDDYFDKYISNDKKFVAIGECGLDYFHNKDLDDIKRQKEVFIKHILKANELNIPLIVHVRDSSEDAKEILMEYSTSGGVLHCFNGDACLVELSTKGFYFGIGGVVTFKNAQKLQETCLLLPKDKIILETDAPYLAPVPKRGKRNESANLVYIAKKLADILGLSYEEILKLSFNNTKSLFKTIML